MESTGTKSSTVARDSPQEAHQLGQGPEQQRRLGPWGCLFVAVASIVLAGRFAWDVYQARHSPRSLAFVIVTYDLTAVLCCCLAKLSLLRRDDLTAAPERRRVRIAVLLVSVALAITIAARVALRMPNLWMKIAVLVVTGVGIGFGFYYFFARADAGRQTEDKTLSPEQRV